MRDERQERTDVDCHEKVVTTKETVTIIVRIERSECLPMRERVSAHRPIVRVVEGGCGSGVRQGSGPGSGIQH